MKKFNKPYLQVVSLDMNESINTTCVIECKCDIDTCTCNMVCGCVGDCTIVINPSK